MLKKLTILAITALVAGCTPPADRLAMPALQSQLQLQPRVNSALLRTVSLPTYAAVEEIAVETQTGLIGANQNVFWADDPQRAVTLVLTRNLSDILSIDVGPEPWPFVELADVAVDVRVAQMLAGADGIFRLSGQFYVGGDRIAYRNSTHRFAIAVPMPDQSLGSIADAQARALLKLSEQIARTLAR
ncbi:PqiC family protein [Yoonia sp.]|uniref:PqiC family protein n=1 Tax=Yoonia sp. TaxID=2212373 RepID=UPI003F6B275C